MNPHAGPNQNPQAEAVEPCATRPAKPMSKQSPNRIFCPKSHLTRKPQKASGLCRTYIKGWSSLGIRGVGFRVENLDWFAEEKALWLSTCLVHSCARTAKKRVKTVLVGVPPNTVNLMPRRPESHTGLAITGKGHGIAENILYEAVLE